MLRTFRGYRCVAKRHYHSQIMESHWSSEAIENKSVLHLLLKGVGQLGQADAKLT